MVGNLQRIVWSHRRRATTGATVKRILLREGRALPLLAPTSSSSSFAARTLAASAATSSQKRALNQEQLQGNAAAATASNAAPTVGAGATSKTAGTGAATSKSSLLPPMGTSTSSPSSSSSFPVTGLAAGAAVAAAGGVYYYFNREPAPAPAAAKLPASVSQPAEPSAAKSVAAKQPGNEKAPSTVRDEAANERAAGHRVASIRVPDKMRGASSAPLPAVATIPPGGHRVTSISLPSPAPTTPSRSVVVEASAPPPSAPPKPYAWNDPSMTNRALIQLRTATLEQAREAIVASHQSLWSSPAAGLEADDRALAAATAADDGEGATARLRNKVAQLAAELSERTKWEAVRLKEFLAMKEQETSQKYLDILQTQRLEFEDILARRLREQEHQLSTQFQQALADKEASVQTLLKAALETQQAEHETDKQAFEQLKAAEISSQLERDFSAKLEEYKAHVAHELQQKVATLTALSQKLASLDSALTASRSSHQGSVKAHKLSAAALALGQKLETSQPAGTELVALQAAAGDRGVIPAAIRTIPPAVYSHGVATLPELQAMFDDVYRQCRRAAMVPAGRPGLEGQLAGIVFSSLKYPPSPDDAAPEDQPNHPEYVLVRAKKHVQLGELELAVEQLEKLGGQVAFTASDWKTSAMNRVAVEKALRVIQLECALVNESLVE